jgi:glycosyltransferase involved in cell wall biosynthesis
MHGMKPNDAPFLVGDLQGSTQRPLRLAVVTETWPPEVNGVAVTLAQLVDALRARRHDVQLVRARQEPFEVPEHDRRFHEVLMPGLPIPRYPHLRMGVPCRRALLRLWSLRRPDIVHIATEGPLGWSALRAARRLKLPVTSDFRTNFHAYSRHYGIGWLHRPIMGYLRRFHNATHRTMVPTDALAAELLRCGFRGLEVVARGVDTMRFSPGRRDPSLRGAWGAGDDDPVALSVGRLAAEKNLETTLSAFEAMRAANARARLVIVGDGPCRAALQARCPDAVFAGLRRGDDLAAHYASADLLLFPSLTETFGNVTAEAMASGLPVVAYDRAAATQLIGHRISGMLAPPGDGAAFQQAAVELATHAALRRTIGRCAQEAVASLGWAAVATRFESTLRAVLRAHWAHAGALPVMAQPQPL